MAASTILFLRVAIAVAVLNAALLPVLAGYLAAPFGQQVEPPALENPLQLRAALEMALLFQIVLFGVHYVRTSVGDVGLMASGFVLGLTDVDALTLSMARSVASGTTIDAACRAIATGIIANSLMKAGIAAVVGTPRFKRQAGAALAAMAAAGAVALFW